MTLIRKALIDEIVKLSPAERIELACDLWDSIPTQDIPPPTEAQMAEIRRRMEEHEKDPSTTIPFNEFIERLRARLE
jgi:putative addiction module component (TIGR02574 family)